jgi:hypothetical protein
MHTYSIATERSRFEQHSVTGRDVYIIAEALIRCIATEQMKPAHLQSWSNLQDARAVFNAYCGARNAVFFAVSRRKARPTKRHRATPNKPTRRAPSDGRAPFFSFTRATSGKMEE